MNPRKIIPLVVILLAFGCTLTILLLSSNQGAPAPAQDAEDALAVTEINDMQQDSSTEQPALKMQEAETAVKQIVAPYGEGVAVTVRSLDGSQSFNINGDERFVSASMIKLLILAELMDRVDDGSISLSDNHVLQSNEIVGGTGVIGSMGAGTSFTIDQLAKYMIAESDNTATNILIDRLGMDSINARAQSLGLSNTDLQRKMMQLNSGVENHMSTNDAAVLLAGMANGKIASQANSDKAIEYLCAQTDNDSLAAGIPNVRFGHKTGSLDDYRHDGGVVFTNEPYVIVVFTKGVSSPNSLMAQISETVYEYLEK